MDSMKESLKFIMDNTKDGKFTMPEDTITIEDLVEDLKEELADLKEQLAFQLRVRDYLACHPKFSNGSVETMVQNIFYAIDMVNKDIAAEARAEIEKENE